MIASELANRRGRSVLDRLDVTQRYLATEFAEGYEDGLLPRRDLVERILRMTGGAGSAASLLLAMGVPTRTAHAQAGPPAYAASGEPQSPFSVPEGDADVIALDFVLDSNGTDVRAYLARPAAQGRFPGVAICHENAGTAEHFRDVARRFVKAGYVAIHLDLLSREGGTEAVPANERAAALTAPGKADLFVQDFRAAIAFLRAHENVRPDAIAMTGYCFGGSVSWNVACREPALTAVAPYYGPPAFPDELANVRAATLGVYGENDARVNASIPVVEAGLSKAGVAHRLVTYPGAMHAFFNDTRPNYHAEASTQAWHDTLEWFATHLSA